jgi:hypothetical protein
MSRCQVCVVIEGRLKCLTDGCVAQGDLNKGLKSLGKGVFAGPVPLPTNYIGMREKEQKGKEILDSCRTAM